MTIVEILTSHLYILLCVFLNTPEVEIESYSFPPTPHVVTYGAITSALMYNQGGTGLYYHAKVSVPFSCLLRQYRRRVTWRMLLYTRYHAPSKFPREFIFCLCLYQL